MGYFALAALINSLIVTFVSGIASAVKFFSVRFLIDAASGIFSALMFILGVYLSADGVVRWYHAAIFVSVNIIIFGILYNVLAKFSKILYNIITKSKGGRKNDRKENGGSC